ncbi:MAG: cysteine rich repeat-containing protein [Candidatus Omnitrophota bacterium]
MKKRITLATVLLVLVLSCLPVQAAEGQGPVEKFATKTAAKLVAGCQAELDKYCQNVTPGEGRLAACIYAHGDKLSQTCESALYESSKEFRNAAENMDAFSEACTKDIAAVCPKVEAGAGRILACLEVNKGKISSKCNQALKASGGDLGQKKEMGT